MSLFAAIDTGSNTFRLLIAEVKDNRIIDVYSDRRVTRLGTGVGQNGKLKEENIEISGKVMKEFSSIIRKHGVKHIRAIATSALREAANANIFITRVYNDTGMKIEIISGDKEADLTLKGILASFSELILSWHSLLIFDIGGGSTEWILYKDKKTVDKGSAPLGVIKLAEKFLKSDPISNIDIKTMNDEITSCLKTLEIRIRERLDDRALYIGTGGTFTTIASIDLGLENYEREKIHLHTISFDRLNEINKMLVSLPLEERKKIKGLEPERADLIIPGVQFTINVMAFFNFNELTVSDYGILEGIILETKEKVEKGIQ